MKQLNRNFRIATAISAIYMNEGETAAVAKPQLTRAEKFAKRIEVLTKRIEADTAALADVRLEQETEGRLSSVTAGTGIVARLGRAGSPAIEAKEAVYDGETLVSASVAGRDATPGTLREVAARVLGVKETDAGLRYKIMFGEGADTDVEVIQASQIVSIVAEAAAA